MLYLLLAWLGVLAARLAFGGARRLRAREAPLRGGLELAAGALVLAWLGWVLT